MIKLSGLGAYPPWHRDKLIRKLVKWDIKDLLAKEEHILLTISSPNYRETINGLPDELDVVRKAISIKEGGISILEWIDLYQDLIWPLAIGGVAIIGLILSLRKR